MSSGPVRILHLEDEPLDSELAEETLVEGGIAVELDRVETIPQLIDALAKKEYSLVISDYTIPGTDPLEALRLVREKKPETPFIFLSGTIGEELATEALRLGASDYVLKQRMEQLAQVVRRTLGKAQERALRKQAELSLRRSEERLRLSQEIAGLGSFEWDFKADRIEWSSQMEVLHGLKAGAFLGTLDAWIELIHPENRTEFRDLLEKARRDGEMRGEWRIVRTDGEVAWLQSRAQVFRDDEGNPARMVGACIDITERKRWEEELQVAMEAAERSKRSAEEATRAKDHFLAILSHELRTPLTAVMPALDALEPLLDAEGAEYLEMARRNIRLEVRLIDDLLDITRIVRGKVELEMQNVDLCTIVQWAAEVCQPEIKTNGQHFALRLEDCPHPVRGDPSRLQQIVWNLIQNAVKFTPPGGCIGVLARKENGKSIVEVHDSGVGMEPEALNRIFNAFEQEARSTTRRFGGLGLGLAISKALVDLHHGTLRVTSKKNEGSSFYLEMPLISEQEQLATVRRKPRHSQEAQLSLRILLVEDHSDTARIISLVLRRAGHHVTHAPDVNTAINLAANNGFDLLLSDLGLPDASGLDLMRQLRAQGIEIPGIAFSGYAQDEDVRKSHAAGFSEHLAKPVDARRLLAMIADVYQRWPDAVADSKSDD